jgi:adenosine deaminase
MSGTGRTSAFVEAVRRLPKAELHVHLDGSVRPATLAALAAERGVALPVTAEALGDWMRVDDARRLEDYLARFEVTLAVMQDAPALERITRELVEDAAGDGTRYVEIRFCPALNTRGGLSLDEVMAAVWRGAQQGEAATGTVARLIVCLLKSIPVPHPMAMAELAVACRGAGVVAFDAAGPEAGHPAAQFAEAFAHARRHDLWVTYHAGEGDGASSIRAALAHCHPDRIGHGTRLREDPALEAYVVDHGIPLEVCPTSNVQTRVAASFAEHPLARHLALGGVVTINTDNRLMSGVSLVDEYLRCAEHLGFDFATLGALALNGFDAAFLPLAQRTALREAAARDLARLQQALAGGDA